MNFFAEVNCPAESRSKIKVAVMDVDSMESALERICLYFNNKRVNWELISLDDFGVTLVAPTKTDVKVQDHIAFTASIYRMAIENPKKVETDEVDYSEKYVVVTRLDVIRAAIAEYHPKSISLSIPEVLVIANASRGFKFE